MNMYMQQETKQWLIQGGGGWGPVSPFLDFFFFTKAKFTSKKLVLNEYEICLKILEMAILEIQIFKTFGKACPQTP